MTITHISIHGYASPDGPYKLNERLSRERTQALKEYVCRLYTFDQTDIQTSHTPEDWEGFEALLTDTAFQQKEAVMRIVTGSLHPDRKEEKLKNNFRHSIALYSNIGSRCSGIPIIPSNIMYVLSA